MWPLLIIADPLADLVVNVVGGVEGGLTVLEGLGESLKKRQDESASSNLAKNVDVNSKDVVFLE